MARIPSEEAIAREMAEWGLDRLPATRRIQQREALLREMAASRRKRLCDGFAAEKVGERR